VDSGNSFFGVPVTLFFVCAQVTLIISNVIPLGFFLRRAVISLLPFPVFYYAFPCVFLLCPGYDGKLHSFTKAQFSTIEVLEAMPMTRWLLRINPCLDLMSWRC